MKTLLLLGLLLLPSTAARAQPTKLNCPGETTVEMRYCAGLQLEQSTKQLNSKLPTGDLSAMARGKPRLLALLHTHLIKMAVSTRSC